MQFYWNLFQPLKHKNVAIFWDTAPYSPYVNRRFEGLYHLQLQDRKSAEQGTRVQQMATQYTTQPGYQVHRGLEGKRKGTAKSRNAVIPSVVRHSQNPLNSLILTKFITIVRNKILHVQCPPCSTNWLSGLFIPVNTTERSRLTYFWKTLYTKTPWSESESELYRPSDRRLSAKRLPTYADRGCHVVSVTDPSGRILSVF
jgi:hypothetical protein